MASWRQRNQYRPNTATTNNKTPKRGATSCVIGMQRHPRAFLAIAPRVLKRGTQAGSRSPPNSKPLQYHKSAWLKRENGLYSGRGRECRARANDVALHLGHGREFSAAGTRGGRRRRATRCVRDMMCGIDQMTGARCHVRDTMCRKRCAGYDVRDTMRGIRCAGYDARDIMCGIRCAGYDVRDTMCGIQMCRIPGAEYQVRNTGCGLIRAMLQRAISAWSFSCQICVHQPRGEWRVTR